MCARARERVRACVASGIFRLCALHRLRRGVGSGLLKVEIASPDVEKIGEEACPSLSYLVPESTPLRGSNVHVLHWRGEGGSGKERGVGTS